MHTFNIAMPLKIHIMIHHLSDYLCMKGTTFIKTTDQVIEITHHKLRLFFDNYPNHNNLEKTSSDYGQTPIKYEEMQKQGKLSSAHWKN